MLKMTFTQPRATFDELLAFANEVRKAGGGNPLDALMPAVPQDQTQCLIAKNLNFNCSVAMRDYRNHYRWVMVTPDKTVRDSISDALGLPKLNLIDSPETWEQEVEGVDDCSLTTFYAVVLPLEIGQIAKDFDRWDSLCVSDAFEFGGRGTLPDSAHEFVREFAPYVEGAIEEATRLGRVNDKGELIL